MFILHLNIYRTLNYLRCKRADYVCIFLSSIRSVLYSTHETRSKKYEGVAAWQLPRRTLKRNTTSIICRRRISRTIFFNP